MLGTRFITIYRRRILFWGDSSRNSLFVHTYRTIRSSSQAFRFADFANNPRFRARFFMRNRDSRFSMSNSWRNISVLITIVIWHISHSFEQVYIAARITVTFVEIFISNREIAIRHGKIGEPMISIWRTQNISTNVTSLPASQNIYRDQSTGRSNRWTNTWPE